jgi:cellulose biosynthesis protein BcsQ
MQIRPENLKKTREGLGLTVDQAARSVHVSKRTWESYETRSPSYRTISPALLELFCIRHGLPFPPVRLDGSATIGDTRIVSILGATGGSGRTQISFEVARALTHAGYRTAVITDAEYLAQENYNFDNPRILHKSRVLFRPSELKDLRIRMRHMGVLDEKGEVVDDRNVFAYLDIKAWRSKTNPQATLEQLRQDTDYLFLDLSRDLETALLVSDIVIVVFDLERGDVYSSTKNVFVRGLRKHAEAGASPKLFTLLTNKKPSSRQNGSGSYAAAYCFGLPLLHTALTTAYTFERQKLEEKFWLTGKHREPVWQFDLITDTAPDSVAALEYRSLASELVDHLNFRARVSA